MLNNLKDFQPKTPTDFFLLLIFIVGINTFNHWLVVISGILYVSIRKVSNETNLISKLNLPQDFFQLSPIERKKALDFAWNIIDVLASYKDDYYHYAKKFDKRYIFGIVIMTTIIFFLSLISLSTVQIQDNDASLLYLIFPYQTHNEEWKEAWKMNFYIFLLFFIIGIYLYHIIKKNIAKEKIAELELKNKNLYNKRIKELAEQFIIQNHSKWIKNIEDNYIYKELKNVTNTEPNNIYTLLSYDYNHNKNILPPSEFYTTYILTTDSYITIVSNVKIDIKANSYQYVNSNSPTPIIQDKYEWNIKEFFYKDIIELDYLDKDTIKLEDFDKNIISGLKSILDYLNGYNEESGILIVGLINGSKYKYPTLKKCTQNLFTEVREKMRKAKINN